MMAAVTTALLVVGGAVAGAAGASVAFGLFLAYRLYHPYRKPTRKPDLTGLTTRQLRIPSTNGVVLDALFAEAKQSDHLVLITHEIGAFKETKLRIARRLVEAGHHVLLFDLRNHGASSRDRAWWPMSERFTDDIEAALRFARTTFPNVKRITLYASSFSTFPALYIVRRDVAQPDSIVLDSGPAGQVDDVYERLLTHLARWMVPWPFRQPLLFPLVKKSFKLFGLKMLATEWPPDLSLVESDVLFIMNENDPVCPVTEIQKISNKIRRHRVWLCPGADHLQAHRTNPAVYEETLLDFLRRPPLAET